MREVRCGFWARSGGRRIRLAGALLALVAAIVWSPVAAQAAPTGPRATDPPDPGRTTAGAFAYRGSSYRYIQYVPRSLPKGRPVPLVVMVHGAQTTAEQEVHATGFNRVAERRHFIVLYPDVEAIGRAAPGPINQSWLFYNPLDYSRGYGDPAAIAAMTRATMAKAPIDRRRVYFVGVSVGGLMESASLAEYPDLYAAGVNVESAGYLDGFCFANGVGIPVAASAQLAFAQMGSRKRVVPDMVITSDGDRAFPHQCGEKALEQALRVDNLVLTGSQTNGISLHPASTTPGHVPGGRSYDVSTYRDARGCLVGEKLLIHGMPHAWPGNATVDPKYIGYTDPTAPNGADAAWAFLRHFTNAHNPTPCW